MQRPAVVCGRDRDRADARELGRCGTRGGRSRRGLRRGACRSSRHALYGGATFGVRKGGAVTGRSGYVPVRRRFPGRDTRCRRSPARSRRPGDGCSRPRVRPAGRRLGLPTGLARSPSGRATLQDLGLGIVRVTVRWDAIEEPTRTRSTGTAGRGAQRLHDAGIDVRRHALRHARAGRTAARPPNVPPIARRRTSPRSPRRRRPIPVRPLLDDLERAKPAALAVDPASPTLYVTRLLNPAYAAIHDASPDRSSQAASPLRAVERAASRRCGSSAAMGRAGHASTPMRTIHMHWPLVRRRGAAAAATARRSRWRRSAASLTETRKAFGRPVRLWLTELGYQSNPPDRLLGVAPATQATYIAAAAYSAWATPRVDMLIQYLYRDEPALDRWQSGLETVKGVVKPAIGCFGRRSPRCPATGSNVALWGQVQIELRGVRVHAATSQGDGLDSGRRRDARPAPTAFCIAVVTRRPGTMLRLLPAAGEPGNTLVVR